MKKLTLVLMLAIFLAGGAIGGMSAPAPAQYGYTYPSPPLAHHYAQPWVGPNTPWTFYNGDWFLQGVLYYFFGNQYGWAPYYANPSIYIVRPYTWYEPKWYTWYQRNPHYWKNFRRHYPYWAEHREVHHYDQGFYEKHHHGQGVSNPISDQTKKQTRYKLVNNTGRVILTRPFATKPPGSGFVHLCPAANRVTPGIAKVKRAASLAGRRPSP